MNIILLGAGKIGSYLASILSKEQHNVTIIDKDPQRLKKLSQESDVATVTGYGTKWEILDDLLENHPDYFIAMTGADESNLISCSIAKNLGYPRTIARVQETGFLRRSRLDFGKLFYVDYFIGAELLAAHDIITSILNPGDLAIENFAHGLIQMRTFIIPKEWNRANTPIKDLDLPEEMIISLIRRKIEQNEEEKIIFPHGNDIIFPGDEITVIGDSSVMYRIHKYFKCPDTLIKSLVIVGGSPIAMRLSHILEKLDIHVKIIEKDEKKCQELASYLPQSTILNHDGTDFNFLLSEGIQNAGGFIACTSMDNTNVLISLLAKKCGCQKIITIINDLALNPILRDQGIHAALSEKIHIANRVLSLVHGKNIISIASLCDNQVKVVEMKVSPHSELVGIPLAELSNRLPKDLLIAAIENRGRIMIGKGTRILSPNDTIIVIASEERVLQLETLF